MSCGAIFTPQNAVVFSNLVRNVNITATREYSRMFEFAVGLQLTIIVIIIIAD